MMQFDGSGSKVCLIYDRACPICRHVAEKYELANHNIDTVNARESGVHLDRATSMGFDLNRGIIVVDGGEYFFAEEAVQRLARTKQLHGILGFIVGHLCRHFLLVNLLYPPLTFLRKILLKILGVPPILQYGLDDRVIKPESPLTEKDSAKTKNGYRE